MEEGQAFDKLRLSGLVGLLAPLTKRRGKAAS
jgi:hypothetical protein